MGAMSNGEAVLVAGGAGYIGSHTAKQLRAAGMRPVVIDNLVTGNRFALRFGPFIQGSIEDQNLVRRAIEEHDVRSAILFAAHAYVGESTTNPRKYYRNNVSNTLTFLDALLANGVRNLVFSSSCSIYGIQARIPISEDSSKNPLNPYAQTKLFMEEVLRTYSTVEGLRSVCLRYFNAGGADPEGELGEHHNPETHLIPLAIYAAIRREPLSVYGADYPTADGTAIRDYVHVTDLATAHVAALDYLRGGGQSACFNLGTGTGHSIRQVLQMVEQVSGLPVPARYGPRRDGDAAVLVADASKADELLRWRPRYSSLESIVRSAWRWHSKLDPS
jgi:UDP-arabinose 4-epimerase